MSAADPTPPGSRSDPPISFRDEDDAINGQAELSTNDGATWEPDLAKDVQADTGQRLYMAAAKSYSILAKDGQPDHRIPAHLA